MNRAVNTIYWLLLLSSFLATAGVYYWEFRYLIEVENPGRHELLIGSATVTLYTSPIWAGFALLSSLSFKILNKNKVLISYLPLALILLPILLRESPNAP